MEESSLCISREQAQWYQENIDKYRDKLPTQTHDPYMLSGGSFMPISMLPYEYRKEIDRGITTGWKGIDSFLGGIRKGEMTVVTADTGAGKTTFCTQLMVNCAMTGAPVWLNSWEMRPEVMLRKVASVVLRKPLKYYAFTDSDSIQFDSWALNYNIFVNPQTVGMDLSGLSKALRYVALQGVQVVLLDHLDYLVSYTREKLHEAIEDTVKTLHQLAFELSIHIVLVCHPKQSMAGEEITMHGLKGSASIKQYADNIIILHRSSRTDSQADPCKVKVTIAKNRMFGLEGVTYLFYQPHWDGYCELHDKDR